MVVHRRFDPDGLLGGAFSGVRRDSSYSSGGKTEDSLGCACVGPPGDDATAHRTWDHGRRSSSSSSSSSTPSEPHANMMKAINHHRSTLVEFLHITLPKCAKLWGFWASFAYFGRAPPIRAMDVAGEPKHCIS